MTQPEALRIAYVIEGGWDREHGRKAAAELRRLHEANEAFGKRQEWWNNKMVEMENALRLALHALEYPGPSWLDGRQPAIDIVKQALGEA